MTRPRLVNLGDGLAARVVEGDDDAVLWLHGYTLDSRSWWPLWQLLPGWRHIGVDLPGHGASLPLGDGEDLPALARRIGGVALERGVRHVVALSFGTVVGLQIAIEYPHELASLTLAAPALGGGPQDDEVGRCWQELAAAYRERGFGPHLRERWMRSPPDLFTRARHRPQLWQQLWQLVGEHGWWELSDGSFARLTHHRQQANELAQVDAATMILVGEHELPAFKRCGELIRRSLAGSRRHYVADLGHLCVLEDPKRTYALIASHLSASADRPAG